MPQKHVKEHSSLFANLCLSGGTFALYSLLARFIGFVPGLKEGSPTAGDLSLGRYSSNARPGSPLSSKLIAKRLRSYIRSNRSLQLAMLLLVLLMTAMVIADGVLTPAQTGEVPNIKTMSANCVL